MLTIFINQIYIIEIDVSANLACSKLLSTKLITEKDKFSPGWNSLFHSYSYPYSYVHTYLPFILSNLAKFSGQTEDGLWYLH